ncbi:prolipoprotein diacylglyceryl transferase [Porphyromonas sp. COT-239 OH1446]|uniref:prolipoprotein diacylglyceryl transferase n=1 Tax=Porphyromonas sp. COT-239 OH1446 TaxID=1515613 RepID=UPI00052BF74F|nr:prolipoprotein diacylglyceryl transferase [Porphyromonas sp. COT-239 OH1446]KGN67183.1 prolipoprotein diacylglyceryl transferase [Porphyromonas sp. COT-239 OH1446]
MLPHYINWDVDPVLFEIFSREIRWYALLFAAGLLFLGPMIEARIWKREDLKPEWLDSLFIYIFVGTIVGARLGHVLFYDPLYYLANPIKILFTWEGGLASHGGTIGVIVAIWLYSRRVTKLPMLWAMDRVAVPVGIVAAMIRLGNLMNSEVFGRPTDVPWGFRFVRSQEYHQLVPDLSIGCHPTQLYEALAYLFVFALCMWLYFARDAARRYSGLLVGVLLSGIFGARIFIERIKVVQEPWELDLIDSIGLNMGQLLSIPFVVLGLWLIVRALKRAKSTSYQINGN